MYTQNELIKLCTALEPTADNLAEIAKMVIVALSPWTDRGRLTPPSEDEVKWIYPFYKFTQSMIHLPSDENGVSKLREYIVGSGEFEKINSIMRMLDKAVSKIASTFNILKDDVDNPHLGNYENCISTNGPWWWKKIGVCDEQTDTWHAKPGVASFDPFWIESPLHDFENAKILRKDFR